MNKWDAIISTENSSIQNLNPTSYESKSLAVSSLNTIAIPLLTAVSTPIPTPVIQNVVATVNLCCKLDLKQIVLRARNSEYNPKRFAACVMRIREPRTTALIFTSGKLICTGAKNTSDSRLATRKYARIIQKIGFPAKFVNFKIQNIVASCDVKFIIRLESLCVNQKLFATYEPEIFPGLIYRMIQPKLVIIIFVSGRIVITGAKSEQDVDEAFNNIYPILQSCKASSNL